MLQGSVCKRAPDYRALLRKMTTKEFSMDLALFMRAARRHKSCHANMIQVIHTHVSHIIADGRRVIVWRAWTKIYKVFSLSLKAARKQESCHANLIQVIHTHVSHIMADGRRVVVRRVSTKIYKVFSLSLKAARKQESCYANLIHVKHTRESYHCSRVPRRISTKRLAWFWGQPADTSHVMQIFANICKYLQIFANICMTWFTSYTRDLNHCGWAQSSSTTCLDKDFQWI